MKARVLAIVDTSYWAIGTTGKLIVRNFSDEFDFFFLPERVLERRPDILQELLLSCDVVLCLNESGATMLRKLAAVPLPPVITWIHHVTAWSPDHQAAIEISQRILACTPGWKEIIAGYCPPGVRIEIVRNGIDPAHFYPRPAERKKFGIPPESFVVGFFAHRGADKDAGRKGIDTLLAVLRKAAVEIPGLAVVMAGPGWEDLAAELRATGASAHMLGFVPRSHVPLLYSLLDVYLLTSRVEGGPLPVLESMACGTPVIATRVGLVPDVVEDGINSFSVEIGDVDGIVRALHTLSEDRELHRRMRVAARTAAERHAAVITHQHLREVLREVVQRPLKRETHTGPEWLNDPVGTSRVGCAAECIAGVVNGVRAGKMPVGRGVRMLRDMLEGVSLADRARALAMAAGLAYKVLK
jgi:glycosyltransferase involved in cell wall biosynthesis